MINFVQPGNVVPITAPSDLTSGSGVFVGKLFGIVTKDAKSGTTCEVMIQGGVSLKRAVGFSPASGSAAVFDAPSQTIISGAGTAVGLVIGPDPDDATRSVVRLIPVCV